MKELNLDFKYEVSTILKIAKENREKHQKIYEEAMINYNEIMKFELEKMLDAISKGLDVSPEIRVKKPKQFLEEYDQVIKMLEITINKEIELDSDMFEKLVMDKWNWSSLFSSNTVVYTMDGNVGIGTANPISALITNGSYKC